MSAAMTRGVVFVHSAPPALCPHVEWALGGVLDQQVSLEWTGQPAEPGTWRAELSWQGRAGTGARLASSLRGWAKLRFEVTEEPSAGADGARWSHTPRLGIHHAVVGVHGDVLVGEDRLRSAVRAAGGDARMLLAELDATLGRDWDDELEPFRYAGDGAPVRWLHRVG
ncbi:DUF3145 domain-containing protein [Angustibacter sp. Root456]|jgi:hypothetical protein|uniref:DUF3145 domain-containing protein n=1 Tax=Angustibacter sp. Root456 TaxID=1736539 RepID=UPI0006F1D7BC|nr:hypothetical protein ASD06_03360 [Angustibacter sp. Root456]